MCRIFFVILLLCLCSVSSYAEKLEVHHGNWSLFSHNEQEQKICYIVGTSIDRSSSIKNRRESYIMITNFTDQKNEFSVSSGYIYKNKTLQLKIDNTAFTLTSHQDSAWPNTLQDDAKIIKLLQTAKKITVTDKKISADSYSLVGFSKIFKAMQKVCK